MLPLNTFIIEVIQSFYRTCKGEFCVMDNEILEKCQRLNNDGRFFVDCALKAAMSNPAYLASTPKEKMQEIKRKNEEAKRKRQVDDEEHRQYFDNLKSEIDGYTEEDYISKLNELFSNMPLYKLRYFYIFISGKLHYEPEGGASA